jgi:hypothetical protein
LRKVLAGGGNYPDSSRCQQGYWSQGTVESNDSIGSKPVGKRRGPARVKQNPRLGQSGQARNEGRVFAGGG